MKDCPKLTLNTPKHTNPTLYTPLDRMYDIINRGDGMSRRLCSAWLFFCAFFQVFFMAFVYYNPNPAGKKVGDCVIRALSKALDESWEKTYIGLALQGYKMRDLMNANHVWGAYLFDRGFQQAVIPNTCPDCYTVRQFCDDYPEGTYVLATGSHVVAVVDGDYFDEWDSGDETPVYVWSEKEGGL